jgi:uncharacterized protein (TIGR02646 family)
MIKLTKKAAPAELERNALKWTKAIEDHISANTTPTKAEKSRYNCKEVKDTLMAETNGKCAYCESKFEHIAYGDIEHIISKNNNTSVHFKWENLTLACDRCNTNKGEKSNILNPYEVDPEELFTFAGGLILGKPQHRDAVITERELKLNRAPLVEKRNERIKRIYENVLIGLQNKDEAIKKVIIEDVLINEVKDDVEFAAVSRAYIKSLIRDNII